MTSGNKCDTINCYQTGICHLLIGSYCADCCQYYGTEMLLYAEIAYEAEDHAKEAMTALGGK